MCSEARPSILPVRLPEASRLSVPDLAEQRERKTTDRKGIFFSSFFLLPTHFSSLPLARLTECLNPSHFTAESNYSLGLTHWRRMETKTNPATLRRQPAEIKTGFQNWSAPRESINRSVDLQKIPRQESFQNRFIAIYQAQKKSAFGSSFS